MSRPRAVLDPDARIVVSRHADSRFYERCCSTDLDELRSEVTDGIRAGRYEWRAREIWYVWTAGRERVYPIAVHGRTLVVITVLTAEDTEQIAA